jgi:hypothetical protein
MSIIAMKNKSLTLHSHVNTGVFSLNGTFRHPPRSLGRLLYPTSMKGTDPKGYGGGSRCRVSGRFARKCGSSFAYPPKIHTPCSTVQTSVKHSVMNTSGKLEKDLLCCTNEVHVFPVRKKICDYVIADVNKTQKTCPPYIKEIGPIEYDTRLRKLKQCLVDEADTIYHQC